MPAYQLQVFFPRNMNYNLGKYDSKEKAEIKKDDIFKNGYSFERGNENIYYPPSSVELAIITYYEKMEPDIK